MKQILLLAAIFLSVISRAQNQEFLQYCNQAYLQYPEIPKGVLEAVSFTQTRFAYLDGNQDESCSGLPKGYGYFGLVKNGKNYFKNNFQIVSKFSHVSENDMNMLRSNEVLAYAGAFNSQYQIHKSLGVEKAIYQSFYALSYLSDSGLVNRFAKDAEIYELFKFLNNNQNASSLNFPMYHLDLQKAFGENVALLSAEKIIFESTGIQSSTGEKYKPSLTSQKSTEYAPAIWNPAPSCNYSSRNGTAISAITIHTIQGTYAGAISWAQNCNSSVSYHYVVRSSDGQVTQMVNEANKAWHVGSENPYTIGYEHEGYIDNASWYTTAMYNASAGITRDICQSGYGINPLRCFSGPATSGSQVLGGCTKIKGHQHYPNQTHTDPGINWNWALYYTLVNNNPTQTTATSSTGSFYDTGGSGANYANDERYFLLIQPAGATSISLNFTTFNTEANWDYLYIYDGATNTSPLIGTYTGTASPGTVVSSGGSMLIEFRSDCATVAAGWQATWTSVIPTTTPPDATPPSTVISNPPQWVTQNFTTTFTDQDNAGGSGLEKSYYQVIDFDGSDWRANDQLGFFSDNFDQTALHSDWTTSTGTWALNNGVLEQTDEANTNTNVYAELAQNLSNRYLYHWSGAMTGAGTNRRAGFHYFCSDGSLPNRGNSYFVFFRLDNAKVQLYKVTNDVFSMVNEVSYTFTAGTWYDFKVVYDRISGKHQVYIDNALVQTYVDSAPYADGDFISFRSGNAVYQVNNLKVYRSRSNSVNVDIQSAGALRYQSVNPSTQAGRIKSIVQDSTGNLSAIQQQDVFVDWTAPLDITSVNDGASSDISTTASNTTLEANWPATADPNSDINSYWVAIGTTPGATDVYPWTDNYWNTNVSVGGLSLTIGTTYYISVKAKNGAGLWSQVATSDGQVVVAPTDPPVASFFVQNTNVCSGQTIAFENTSTNGQTYMWSFTGATPASSSDVEPQVAYTTSGTYSVQLIVTGPGGIDTLVQTVTIDVSQPIMAQFGTNATDLYLPNAIVTCTNSSTNANGYFWDFGDGTTSSDANPWHQYTQEGDYTITLIGVNNACPNDTAVGLVHVFDDLGVDSGVFDPYLIFPNPVNETIHLTNVPSSAVEYTIYDLNGKRLNSHQLNGEINELKVDYLLSGVYKIVLSDTNGRVLSVGRFLKI